MNTKDDAFTMVYMGVGLGIAYRRLREAKRIRSATKVDDT